MTMGSKISREVLIYTVATFIASGIQYIAVPIYTRIFEPVEYSKLVLVQTLTGLVAGVVVLGGDTALARYWFAYTGPAARRRLTVTWIAFLTGVVTVVTLLLLPAAGLAARWSFDEPGHTALFVVGLLFLVPAQTSRLTAQVLRNEFRAFAFAGTAVALGCLTLVLGLIFVLWLGLGIVGILVGAVVAEVIVLFLRLALTREYFLARPDWSMLRPLLRFGVPLVPVTLSFWVFTTSDRLVVAKLASLRALGVYSVAATLAAGFGILLMAVGQAWTPRAVQICTVDPPGAAIILGRALTYFLFLLSFVAVVASAGSPWIVKIISGPEYRDASQAIPILLAGTVAYGSSILTGTGLVVGNRTRLLPGIASGAALVNLVLAVALVPVWGIVGAATASAVGYSILTCGYLWLSQRSWPVILEGRRLLVTAGSLAIAVVLCTWAGTSENPIRLLVPVGFLVVVLPVARIGAADRVFILSMLGIGTRG